MARSGHKLNYHTHSARAHFHWTKWIVLFSLLLLLAAAGIAVYASLPTLRHRWFAQQCLLYELDPTVAVFDSRLFRTGEFASQRPGVEQQHDFHITALRASPNRFLT